MQRNAVVTIVALALAGCGAEDESAQVRIKNDFNDPAFSFNPPWTICKSSYLGTEFGQIGIGATSAEKAVEPGLDNVLMVAAWSDPACGAEHSLPIASANEEEVVGGQTRTIAISMANHQGPCPPEGVVPIPQALYDRILALWPEYGFKPYAQRAENPPCSQ